MNKARQVTVGLFIVLVLIGCTQEKIAEPTMRIVVGKTADFSEPATQVHPYNNETFPKIWITNKDGTYFALDRQTPHFDILGPCDFFWQKESQQLLDPCSGAIFQINGKYIEGPVYRNIHTYPVEEINGRLYVDFGNIQEGEYVHPYYYSIIWTKSLIKEAGFESLEAYLEQAGYLPYTKDK